MKVTIVAVERRQENGEPVTRVDLLIDGKPGFQNFPDGGPWLAIGSDSTASQLFSQEPAYLYEIRDRIHSAPDGKLEVPVDVELGDRWMWLRQPPRPIPAEVLLTGIELEDEFEFEGGTGLVYRAHLRIDGKEHCVCYERYHRADPDQVWCCSSGDAYEVVGHRLGAKINNAITAFHEGQPKPLPFDLKAWDIYNDPWWKAGVERSRRALEAEPPRRPSR